MQKREVDLPIRRCISESSLVNSENSILRNYCYYLLLLIDKKKKT